MKALLFRQHGDLDQVFCGEIEKPEVAAGQVLVKTRAAALNHLDFFVLKGLPHLDLEMPHILGSDGAGVVEAVGEGATHFSPGDRVMLDAVLCCDQCEFCIRGEHSLCMRMRIVGEATRGTYAEYFSVPQSNLGKIPSHVTFEEAAAFSLVFRTAWRMLVTQARIRPGDDVFIHGIGGGVSSAALPIVKLCGGRAFVSSSSDDKLQKAKELGADFCYNYEKSDVVREVIGETGRRGVDVVVDSVGASTWLQSLKLVRKGGRIVTCGATTGPNSETEIRLIFWKHIEILGSTMSNRSEYRQLTKLLRENKLRPVVDRTFALSEGKEALQYLRQQKQFGKIVLTV